MVANQEIKELTKNLTNKFTKQLEEKEVEIADLKQALFQQEELNKCNQETIYALELGIAQRDRNLNHNDANYSNHSNFPMEEQRIQNEYI